MYKNVILTACQIYSEFISRFDKALKTLEETTKKNPQFARVLREFEAQPACAQLPLAGYMLEIVQRIPRYKLLLTGLYVLPLSPLSPSLPSLPVSLSPFSLFLSFSFPSPSPLSLPLSSLSPLSPLSPLPSLSLFPSFSKAQSHSHKQNTRCVVKSECMFV